MADTCIATYVMLEGFEHLSRVVSDSDVRLFYRQPRTDRLWHTVQRFENAARVPRLRFSKTVTASAEKSISFFLHTAPQRKTRSCEVHERRTKPR